MTILDCTQRKLGPATQKTLQLSPHWYIALIKLLLPWGINNQIPQPYMARTQNAKPWLFWHPQSTWAVKIKMPWKAELIVAEKLYYLPMQLSAYSLQSRNIPETNLNFLAEEQTEFTVGLAKLIVLQEVTGSSDFFSLLSLCFKDSL